MTPAANFNRVAAVYRWCEYAALGPLLTRARNHFIPQLADRRQALVLGDGDGRFLAELLRRNNVVRASVVDLSTGMLARLQVRCAADGARISTQVADVRCVRAAADTDLVVSHFLLDCFPQAEVDALVQNVAGTLRPGALWLVSDFYIPPQTLWRHTVRAGIRSLYFAFRVLTGLRTTELPDPTPSFRAAGFKRLARRTWLGGSIFAELWQLQSNSMEPHEPNPHDAQPDPEPAAPSLPGPDEGVFHHEPAPMPATPSPKEPSA